jgi:hypothetical protein
MLAGFQDCTTTMLKLISTLVTFGLCVLPPGAVSQKFAILETNQWRLSNLLMERFDPQDRTPDLNFLLYRTMEGHYRMSKSDMAPSMPRTWEMSPNPIGCSYGMVGTDIRFRTPAGEWKECRSYPLNPHGEYDVPQERKKWIKWRTIGLEEHPHPTNASLIEFEKMKIEIVQGIQLAR